MSRQLIERYYAEVEEIVRFGGSRNETSIRTAFQILLNDYCKKKNLLLITELSYKTNSGKTIAPDGTVKDALRLDSGYWESKDEYDDLDDEIKRKFEKGYPRDNIIFEDSKTAILFQNGVEALRINMKDADALDNILTTFIEYEKPEIRDFRTAIEKFKEDIPSVADALREMIEKQATINNKYVDARDKFLRLCRDVINPDLVAEDVREMIVQHILTEDIFNTVFDETQFHRENNIALELENVLKTFFHGDVKRNYLGKIHYYYKIIKARASGIASHNEKQKFLKVIYENFYKAYSPKKADRLGVVYTPNEIVKFMIESTDQLCYKHFGKLLSDRNVEILDPATGTGTYITELIEYIPADKLEYKYENEIHANEVEILPYYIANLNIEFSYKQKMGKYKEFKNICFVDTLDNLGFEFKGQQIDVFGGLSEENLARIKRQNERKISVIIGNPPYNANQMNENENNKNREYPGIDKRIKDTFIKASTAQKTKMYDMYARFYRWAMDRIGDDGIIAFVTNRSYINSRTFDGFRKIVHDDFNYCYIIDTQSDVRANPKIAGTTHNVFGIQTGVAITFLIKKAEENEKCKIYYHTLKDEQRKEEKLEWLQENKTNDIPFEHIRPDKKNNWLDIPDNDFDDLIPVANIFKIISPGVNTAKDEWVFDENKDDLINKTKYFINKYNHLLKTNNIKYPNVIKWSAGLKDNFRKNKKIKYDSNLLIDYSYRPYHKLIYYSEKIMSDRLTLKHYQYFGKQLDKNNCMISFNIRGKDFIILSSSKLVDFHFTGDSQCLPLYRYDAEGKRRDNITDWGLEQFRTHYKTEAISKEDIFHYTYGVLHNPAYRKKYELNLKREFPRLPFYGDFGKWAARGKKLMDIHINFEQAEPYPLERTDSDWDKDYPPKAKLRADKAAGTITLDEQTIITGVPEAAWDYRLGNRSALEWVLDQYKEKKPRDPTIREKFNTYRFADYKEKVIDLLQRVCTVSVGTMAVIGEMGEEEEYKLD